MSTSGWIILCLCSLLLHQAAAALEDGDMQLLMAHTMWRHGDRSPSKVFPTDPIRADYWNFGGGGLGELTPIGMEQQMRLGARLRDRYVDGGLLSPHYNSKEIYIHSTSFSRTINSATANMIGMYSQGAQPNSQIPHSEPDAVPRWPDSFVPIPIHTAEPQRDYLGRVDTPCPRQDALWKAVMATDEWKEFIGGNETVELFSFLSNQTEWNITYSSLRSVYDTLHCEIFHNLTDRMAPFYSTDLMKRMKAVNDRTQDFFDGLHIPEKVRGLNLKREIGKIRAGTLFGQTIDRMRRRIACLGKTSEDGCESVSNLKYYAVSAHDSTLFAYLVALGAQDKVLPEGGYPHYAAVLLTELWADSNGSPFVKVHNFRPPT